MNNKIAILSDQPHSYDGLLSCISINKIKKLQRLPVGFSPEMIFVLVEEKFRKRIEHAIELLDVELPIVDFGDYLQDPFDKQYILGEIFTSIALKKISNLFSHMCVKGTDSGGETVPVF